MVVPGSKPFAGRSAAQRQHDHGIRNPVQLLQIGLPSQSWRRNYDAAVCLRS
jgi:hypothetical protein